MQTQAILREYVEQLQQARHQDNHLPPLPERLIADTLDNTWHDTAEAVLNNWIGKVYQTTNNERGKQFMDGVNPQNPLNLPS